MWDVKNKRKLSRCTGYCGFYMNYVGCKVPVVPAIAALKAVFYMNYVGCKVFKFCAATNLHKLFYMNYVGCKG